MRELYFAVIALAAVAIVRGEETALVPKNETNFIIATQCPVYEDENEVVFIPHEFDCTMYYVCKAGRQIPMYCAYLDEATGERLQFNPSTERCDWPGSFQCGGGFNPDPNQCVGSAKSSHENNCGYYYECVGGRKALRACTVGLHFNPFAQMCQTPDQAGCSNIPIPSPTPPRVECIGDAKGLHETNCGYYYECVGGRKVLRACAAGLHFNPFAQMCQTPDQAGCSNIPIPSPTPPRVECVGNHKSTHETNCGYYYECVGGRKALRACAVGLHFNPFAQICQTPDQAGCEKPAIPSPTPPLTECVGTFRMQDDSKCEYYFECISGRKVLLPCPVGLHFNPFSQTCQPPDQASCSVTLPSTGCVGSALVQHESICAYYYECVNGRKTLRSCGAGLHFNAFAQICQIPSKARCDTTEPNPRPTPRPTPRPVECIGGFKSPHESNCGYYYDCVNGRKTLRFCGAGLHFNAFAQICQIPSEAGCDTVGPLPRPTPRPTPRPVECIGGFKSPHESNCGYYYDCVNGKKMLRACGKGIHFNPFAQTCQLPSEAGCQNSITRPKPTIKPEPTPIECYGNFRSPHESQCQFYYTCVNGKVTLQSCSAGWHFNAFAQTCQPAAEAGCHLFLNALTRISRDPHDLPQKVDA